MLLPVGRVDGCVLNGIAAVDHDPIADINADVGYPGGVILSLVHIFSTPNCLHCAALREKCGQAMRSARKLCLQLWTQRTQKRLYFLRPLSPMKNDHSCRHFLLLLTTQSLLCAFGEGSIPSAFQPLQT